MSRQFYSCYNWLMVIHILDNVAANILVPCCLSKGIFIRSQAGEGLSRFLIDGRMILHFNTIASFSQCSN